MLDSVHLRSVFILAYFVAMAIHVLVLLLLLLLGWLLLVPVQPAALFFWLALAVAVLPLVLVFRRMRRPGAMTLVAFFARVSSRKSPDHLIQIRCSIDRAGNKVIAGILRDLVVLRRAQS